MEKGVVESYVRPESEKPLSLVDSDQTARDVTGQSSHIIDHEEGQEHGNDQDVERGASPSSMQNTTLGSHQEKDPNIVDWDGPDDPDLALNWSPKKKLINTSILSAMSLLTPLASSMFAPGVPEVMVEFKSTNVDLASFVVSVYILGYAFGPLLLAPLSELYGRTIVYHVNSALFIIFNVACALSTSLSMLIGFRFLAGFAGSCAISIGSGSIADCYKQEERGKAMSIWTMGVLLGPVIGPVAGGYISQAKGWRWDFWVLVIVTGGIYSMALLFQSESYAPVILERRARRLRKKTGNKELRSALQSTKTPRELFLTAILRPTKMLLFSPVILVLSLYIAIGYGYLYLIFTTMTEVFEKEYGISQGNVGLTYLGIGVGLLVGLFAFGALSDSALKRMAKGGEMKPEYRLPPVIPGGLLVPIGLFWYGWTAEYHQHWILPIIGLAFLGLGQILCFMPIGTYLVDAFTIYAASAMAANTVLRSLGGALLPLCGNKMYDKLGLGWGNSLLAFIGLALNVPVFFFIRYGEQLRKHPKFQLKL